VVVGTYPPELVCRRAAWTSRRIQRGIRRLHCKAGGCSDIERRGERSSPWALVGDPSRHPKPRSVARPSSLRLLTQKHPQEQVSAGRKRTRDCGEKPGAKARDWATRTFTTEAYVNILEGLIEQFVEAKPLLAVGEKIGRELAALSMKHDDPAIDRLAADMHGVFRGSHVRRKLR